MTISLIAVGSNPARTNTHNYGEMNQQDKNTQGQHTGASKTEDSRGTGTTQMDKQHTGTNNTLGQTTCT